MSKYHWVRVMALTLSYPSAILALAYFSYYLSEEGYLSFGLSIGLFIFLVGGMLLTIVGYAIRKKD